MTHAHARDPFRTFLWVGVGVKNKGSSSRTLRCFSPLAPPPRPDHARLSTDTRPFYSYNSAAPSFLATSATTIRFFFCFIKKKAVGRVCVRTRETITHTCINPTPFI